MFRIQWHPEALHLLHEASLGWCRRGCCRRYSRWRWHLMAVDWTTRLAHEHRESCEYKGLITTVVRWYPFQMNPTERWMVIKYDLEVPNPSIQKTVCRINFPGFSAHAPYVNFLCLALYVLSLWVQFTVCGAAPWASHGRWEPKINFSIEWLLCVEWWSFGLWFLVVVLVGKGHVFNVINSPSLMAVIRLRRWLMGYVSSCWRSRKKQKSGKKEAWMVFWIALNSLHAWAGREINWFGFWK